MASTSRRGKKDNVVGLVGFQTRIDQYRKHIPLQDGEWQRRIRL